MWPNDFPGYGGQPPQYPGWFILLMVTAFVVAAIVLL